MPTHSYRVGQKPPPQKNRTVQKTTTRGKVFIENGTTFDIAIPCFYKEVRHPVRVYPHNRKLHDHFGWPNPSHPDHICQLWNRVSHCCEKGHKHKCSHQCRDFLDMSKLWPIHLTEEGYHTVSVALKDAPEGLSVIDARIDEQRDWIVRVLLDCETDAALEEKVVVPFTIKVIRGTGAEQRKDIVSRGKIVILPGTWEE